MSRGANGLDVLRAYERMTRMPTVTIIGDFDELKNITCGGCPGLIVLALHP